MNIEQTKQAIEIMQAFWDWGKYQYRIKSSLYHPKDLPENRLAKVVYPNSTYHDNIVIRYGGILINIGRGRLRWWDNIDRFGPSFKCQLIDEPVTLDPKDD
jgi:hypothetical protein